MEFSIQTRIEIYLISLKGFREGVNEDMDVYQDDEPNMLKQPYF